MGMRPCRVPGARHGLVGHVEVLPERTGPARQIEVFEVQVKKPSSKPPSACRDAASEKT